ncbi:unnamed protein product, partial [Didymodactylos carnosus]
YEEEEEKRQEIESKRQYLLDRSKEKRLKDVEMMAKIRSSPDLGYDVEIEPMVANTIDIPKTPPLLTKQALERKKRQRKEVEMQVG